MIWKQTFDLDALGAIAKNTMVENLGIEFTEYGDDYIIAKMPVDDRTVQPMRLLHGGASVALAETLGSMASQMCLPDVNSQGCVGVEINANHLSSARDGYVFGKVTPIRIGRTLHVWNIEVTNAEGKKICVSRLTVAVIDLKR